MRIRLVIKSFRKIKSFNAYDVIALDHDHMIVVGKDGLYQLDASNPKSKTLQYNSIQNPDHHEK